MTSEIQAEHTVPHSAPTCLIAIVTRDLVYLIEVKSVKLVLNAKAQQKQTNEQNKTYKEKQEHSGQLYNFGKSFNLSGTCFLCLYKKELEISVILSSWALSLSTTTPVAKMYFWNSSGFWVGQKLFE